MDVVTYSASPAEAGLPSEAMREAYLWQVDDPLGGSPYYPVWVAIHAAMSAVGYNEDAAAELIGMLDVIRTHVANGYAPTEYHDPLSGAYARLEAGGWMFLHAPSATCLRTDLDLSLASVEVESFPVWFDAISSVVDPVGGIGKSAAVSAPLFWTGFVGFAYEASEVSEPDYEPMPEPVPVPEPVEQVFTMVAQQEGTAIGYEVDYSGSLTPTTLFILGVPHPVVYMFYETGAGRFYVGFESPEDPNDGFFEVPITIDGVGSAAVELSHPFFVQGSGPIGPLLGGVEYTVRITA